MNLFGSVVLLCTWLISETAADLPSCDEYDVTVLATDGTAGKIIKVKYDLIQVKRLPVVMTYKPTAIVYDPVTTRIYWTDLDLKQIRSSDPNGRNEQKLVNLDSDSEPYGLAIDPSARKLFYTDQFNLRIGILDLDGSRHDDVLLDTDPDQPLDIVLHPRKRLFFWSTYKPLPYIARTSYDAITNKVLVKSGLIMPLGITLDEESETLYWCDQLTKRIESVTTEGTNRRVILQNKFTFFDIFYYNGNLYFTDTKQKAVLYVSTDDTSKVESIGSTVIGQMARVFVFPSSSDNRTVTILGTDWLNKQIISVTHRLPDIQTLPISIITRPQAIDYDPMRKEIYWTDEFLKHIRRANLDGSNETLVATLSRDAVPDAMAVDTFVRKVFYTDAQNDLIAVVGIDGGNQETVIAFGLDEPRAIILDEKKRVLYWAEWGVLPTIAVAHYDGTHRRTLVSRNLYWPSDLALDQENEILYWRDGLLQKIESVTTEGELRRTILYKPNSDMFSLFVLDYTLFIGSLKAKAIMSMSVSGGEVTTMGFSVFSQISGLYVISNRNETACSSTVAAENIYQAAVQKYKPS